MGPNYLRLYLDGLTTARGAAASIRYCGGSDCPRYEFTAIPHNGWDCVGLFVANVSIKAASITISWDGKLEIVDFSNARVSFLSVSSIHPCIVLTSPVVIP
jgi:hypothetical protein